MNPIELSMKRPTLLFVFYLILIGFSLFGARQIGFEMTPKIASPIVTITTIYPGASPEEIENDITITIEDALSQLEYVDEIKSSSRESFSVVRLALTGDADADEVMDRAIRKINNIKGELPDDAQSPIIQKFDVDEVPIIKLALNSSIPESELFRLVDEQIQPTLIRIGGVSQVSIAGGREENIQIDLDRQRMLLHSVTPMKVVKTLQRENITIPAGVIQNGNNRLPVKVTGKYGSLEELKNLVLVTTPRGTVRLNDVARISLLEEDHSVLARVNQESALALFISKQSDANAVEIAKLVREQIADLEIQYRESNVQFTVIQDSSEFIIASAKGVFRDLFFAIILVGLSIFVFLQTIRNSLTIMVVVPVSLLITVGVMYLFGYTFNMISLLALTLAVGTLVDDAIVVIENIIRHKEMGKDAFKAAYDGTVEVGLTIVATTLSLIVVFLPIAFATGLVGSLLAQFAVILSISIILSTVSAFTIVPWLSSVINKTEEKVPNWLENLFEKMEAGVAVLADIFTGITAKALKVPKRTLVLIFLAFIGSLMLLPLGFIGAEFMDSGDRGEFILELELNRETPLDVTLRSVEKAESHIRSYSEVKTLFSVVGASSGGSEGEATPYSAEISVVLVDKELRNKSAEEIANTLRLELEGKLIGVKVRYVPINMLGFREQEHIQIDLVGNDSLALNKFARKVKDAAAAVPGVVYPELSIDDAAPELQVTIDRSRMHQLGLSAGEVGQTIRTALHGSTQDGLRIEGTERDILVRLDALQRRESGDLESLSFINHRGEAILLSQFATVNQSSKPANRKRLNRTSAISFTAKILGRPKTTVGREVLAAVESLERPAGIDISSGGEQKRAAEGFATLGGALIASIILVYLILVALYDSFIYPFVVLFTIPLAIIGTLLVLALSRSSLSLFSMLGILMLVGLVAKNAILVVDFALEKIREGMEESEALIYATKNRFRPVLMTNISMIVGMVPLALSSGAGAEWKTGLGWTLIGGLTSSMFLSLIIVPVIYRVIGSIESDFLRVIGKRDK